MTQPTMESQVQFWNSWIHETRHGKLDGPSQRRRDEVLRHMDRLNLRSAKILEVGCANGWLAASLARYGSVTGTDLADAAIAEAKANHPHLHFVAGDFMTLDFHPDHDVVVCVDSLASVAHHEPFIAKLASHVKSGGHLILTSQNPLVFATYRKLRPVAAGQVRNWASRPQLRELLQPYFDVLSMRTVLPQSDHDHGIFGIANSRWVNFPAKIALLGQRNVDRLKEALGWGQTIVVLARRNDTPTTPKGRFQ